MNLPTKDGIDTSCVTVYGARLLNALLSTSFFLHSVALLFIEGSKQQTSSSCSMTTSMTTAFNVLLKFGNVPLNKKYRA